MQMADMGLESYLRTASIELAAGVTSEVRPH